MKIAPTGAALGAEIVGLDIRQPLDGATVNVLTDAWHTHLILIIRGNTLTNEQQMTFTRNFGALEVSGVNMHRKHHLHEALVSQDGIAPPEIEVVSNIKVEGKAIGSLGNGEAIWHTDSSFVDVPTAGSFLHALEIPPKGGDTWFCNMYMALETLPAHLRHAIEGRSLLHAASYDAAGILKKGAEAITDIRRAGGARHPIVRTHPDTGRSALYLGRRPGAWVVGMPLDDSEDLLDALWAHATQSTFVYRHRWRQGDLVIWDNRCVMHRRDAFDPAARRLMHRTQTIGTRPV